jgi:hypothetical protein
MAGQFRGGGEVIRTFVEAATWKLGGGSQQEGIAASAVCLTWPAAASIAFTSETSWEQGGPEQTLGDGNRACLLTTITGSFRGFGERVMIRTEGTSWRLTGDSQQSGVAAVSRCLTW